jgi:hypothetical protein
MSLGKTDAHARKHWGAAYDAVPKSVFATLAWRLADRIGPEAVAVALEELDALAANGIIPEIQTNRAVKAIGKG